MTPRALTALGLLLAASGAPAAALLVGAAGEGCLVLEDLFLRGEGNEIHARARLQPAARCPHPGIVGEPERLPGGATQLRIHDAAQPQRLLAFALRDPGPPPAWQPESGMWWTLAGEGGPGVPGSGLFLEVQQGVLAAWIATYDGGGGADWWLAAGPLAGRVFHGELLAFHGGPPAFAASEAPRELRSAGQIAILFHGPARGEAWLAEEREGALVLRSLAIARFVFGGEPGVPALAGEWRWHVAGEPSQGLQLAPVPAGGGVLLADLGRRVYLECDPAGEELPRACRLRGIGGTLPLAELDTVGYHRLLGRDAEGRPVELSRVPGPSRGDQGSPPPAAGGE